MPKTADKLSDPISRQALIDAIQDSLNRHCQPWTPTPREKRAARPKSRKIHATTAQLKEQAAQIQKVSAQLEVSKSAPQVVVNKP